MGKSLPSSTRLQELTRIIASDKFSRPKRPTQRWVSPPQTAKTGNSLRVDPERASLKMESSEDQGRVPLARVVSDCAKRWFQDTLKEAKGGDTAMQVLVGQMYHSGYGVQKNPEKGHAWISRASRSRRAAWKVSEKQPGYHASDSDSDELEDVAK
ncbi:uncharacterized protein LOC126802321 [Argentina anserina]|uniref:uncharacterized protein LOC126802321 n=1 Tax=Argentina anserina TaxID=57926 RepID=UPI0021761EA4|nr:uncharacterized protein LOC126802321 [Potentilla anserina]XP_050385892.1 uncharacterized protein LOC126802321 [Potentilla anserina]